jgi:hypothetical protein
MFDYVPMDSALDSYPTIVIAANSNVTSDKPLKIGVCEVMQPGAVYHGSLQSLGVVGIVAQYLSKLRGIQIDPPPSTSVTLIEPPKHGRFLVAPVSTGGWPDYLYLADRHFKGQKDSFTVRVEIDGEPVELVIFIHVVNLGDDDLEPFCEKIYGKGIWRISPDNSSSLLNGLNLTFSSLPGPAVAQTTGSGTEARIPLDTDAAGHGWCIDYTPYLNEEYLHTRSPYEWIAKPGSSVESKIDLLSVLWRGLGHAHGLGYTADSHGPMSVIP